MDLRRPKAGVPEVRIACEWRTDVLFRINRVLMYLAVCGYVPITLVLVSGMAYVGYWLSLWALRLWWLGPLGWYAVTSPCRQGLRLPVDQPFP
jgi:hypothetical protein